MSHVDPTVEVTHPTESPVAEPETNDVSDQLTDQPSKTPEAEPEAAPSPTAPNTDDARLEELRAQIETRKQAIAKKKAETSPVSADSDRQLWEIKSKHQTTVKEASDLERKKADAAPEFERLNENADLRDTYLKLTEDIETNEVALREEEEAATTVEARCKETTLHYANESRRSTEFLNAIQTQMDQLQSAFAKKIAATSEIDPEGVEAFDHLQDISVAVMARGKQLSTLTKILREQECLLAINATRKDNVHDDFKEQNVTLLQQKDEHIRSTIFRFQDERAKLHQDIEDMQRINKEQAAALKAGEVQKRNEKGGMGVKSTPSTRPKDEQAALNADVEALTEKLALAKSDIAASLEGIRSATKIKSDLIKEDKTLQSRTHWDRTHQDAELATIAQSTQLAILAKERQEKENDKLAEAIKLLTKQVRRLKEAAETIENRTRPLPIE